MNQALTPGPSPGVTGEGRTRQSGLILSRRGRGVAEFIAEAADGLDLVGALAELSADGGDVDVDRAVEDVGVAAEGGVDDVVAGEDAAGLAREELEDAKLGGGQGDALAAPGHLVAGDVDREVAVANDLLGLGLRSGA